MRFATLPVAERDGGEGGRGLGRKRRRGAVPRNLQPSLKGANIGSAWFCWRAREASSTLLAPSLQAQGTGAVPVQLPAELAGFRLLCCNFRLCPAPIPSPCLAPSPWQPSRLSPAAAVPGCAPDGGVRGSFAADSRGSAAWLRGFLVGEASNRTAVWKPSQQTTEQCRAWFLLSGRAAEPARLPNCCCGWPLAGRWKPRTNACLQESRRCSVLFSDALGSCICCALSV